MKNVKIATLNISRRDLYKSWLTLTKSYHDMSTTEIDTVASMMYYYYNYRRTVRKPEMAWKLVMDYDTKMKIKEDLDISDGNLQNRLSSLRRKGVLDGNEIRSVYMPDIDPDASNFKVVFNYNIVDEQEK